MDVRLDVEVYAESPASVAGERWRCGSGYLLAPRLVLTAAHAVCSRGIPLSTVVVRGKSGELFAAGVVWHRAEAGIDVALLEVTDPDWPAPPWPHPVRYGRFVTGLARQACEAVGYPRVVSRPELRDTHHATGSINPKSLLKAGLLAMEVSNPPSGLQAGSGWAGMSGAGVLCSGLLIGVVTTDPDGFNSRRLVLTPITTLLGDASFTELIGKHTGSAPVLEPVELSVLQHRPLPPSSPADLLRADAATTRFRHRPELAQLRDWCQDPAPYSVRLVTGPGGQGKTRLARQLITELTQRPPGDGVSDWAGLIMGDHASPDELAVVADVTSPTLVVVDYAEGRSTTLDPLFAAARRAQAKVRLLLLARTAGAWRTHRVAPTRHMEILADERIVLALGTLETDTAGRTNAWREAVSAFAARLGDLDGYHNVPWRELASELASPVLNGEVFRTVLAVQMDALAALLRVGEPSLTEDPAGSAGRAEEVLLRHEQRYWSRVAGQHQVDVIPMMQRCLVALATLWGAGVAVDARRVVAAALHQAERDDLVVNAADWLGTLYQADERYWSGLQPDRLGEYLVASTLGPSGDCPDLIARTRSSAASDQLERGLTILGRAHPHHPALREALTDTPRETGLAGAIAATKVATRLPAPEPLLAAVEQFAETAEVQALLELDEALPRTSLVLGPTALMIATTLVRRLRELAESSRKEHLPNLARSIQTRAIRLGDVGRRREALVAAQEAVKLRRELAEGNRDVYLPDLAKSMNGLGVRLARVGRQDEGLAAAQEAVKLYRELAEGDCAAHLPDLAVSVHNLANHLGDAGRWGEALAAAQEAVKLRRELAEGNREEYLPNLVRSISNLALRLDGVGRRGEALVAAQEAVTLSRELVEGNRDAHLPDLAMTVNNLASRLGGAGRWGEALAAAQEAVKLYRELAEGNRDAYLPHLASSISNLALRLDGVGRRGEALVAAQEAVKLYRELAEGNRDAYLPHLASSISNLALRLDGVGRRGEALVVAQEAADLCRELVEGNRDAHLPLLALSVHNLANHLTEAGRRGEALVAAQEAADLCRELVEGNRDAYLPDLAVSVHNLALRLDDAGRRGEALVAAQEAVTLSRELAEGNRDAHHQLAIDSGHPEHGAKATLDLGVLLAEWEDLDGAAGAYQLAIDSGHPEAAVAAAVNLEEALRTQTKSRRRKT